MTDKRRGRPTKYEERMCDTVLELMREGASISEVCLDLNICRDTFYRWIQENQDFSDTVKSGLELSKGWWEKRGRMGTVGLEEINPTLWFMNMKNRFGHEKPAENIIWRDKQDYNHQSEDGSMAPKSAIDVSKLSNATLAEILSASKE